MTLGEILHFPMIHFYFHVGQIARPANHKPYKDHGYLRDE